MAMMAGVLLLAGLVACGAFDDFLEQSVTTDNLVLRASCSEVSDDDRVIGDGNDDGVIQIGASDITVEFAPGAVLRGAKKGTRPDEYKGYGIRINGQKNVTLRNVRVHGYWCGIWATHADGLTIEDADASD